MTFPQFSIGELFGEKDTVEVHWLQQDLAMLTVDGDEIIQFCSVNSGGFIDVADVMDQAADVLFDLEMDPANWEDDDE